MQRTEFLQGGDPALVRRIAAILHGLPHFEAAELALLEVLVWRAALVALAPGEVLIREGDVTATKFYVLIDGALAVRSGARLINRLEQPGDVVGELAVLQAPPRTADVVAESATRVLALRPELISTPEFAGLAALTWKMLSHSLAGKLRGMTTRASAQLERVEREAATDRLTGLANRKRLDEFLAALAPAAARYGGEEFVVVLPNCDLANALAIAEKLRAAIERESFPHAQTQPQGRVTATFGVASQSGPVDTAQLLARADQAMYRGKLAGRNRVATAD